MLKASGGGQRLLVFPSDQVPAGKCGRGQYLLVLQRFEAI